MNLSFSGILIGLGAFLIIGLFHPIVIRTEYRFGKKVWPVFLAGALVFLLLSVFISHSVLSALLAVIGFTCLWSIRELFEQEERVRKGWFPANPARANRDKNA